MKTGIINPYELNTISVQKIPEINTIKISREAFYKMNLYSSIVSEISGGHKECLGTLLNYKNRNDNIVRDIHLERGQEITGSNGWREKQLDDSKEVDEKGMYVIGLWHSHGNNGVFHSGYDNAVLKEMFPWIKNKMVVGEKPKSIECIADGETIRIFEEGSNKELRIKGKIEDLKFVGWDKEYFILNSIVINKNSYYGGFSNPKLNYDYDAEVWVGYNKPAGRDYKTFKGAKLEIVEESNNIKLDEEELVKEVGEKVRLRDVCFDGVNKPYLKDLPNYQKVLEKYKRIKNAKNQEKPIEQTVNLEEKPKEKSDLTDIIQKQSDEHIQQEIEHSQELQRTKTYMERLEEFYNTLNSHNNSTDKILADLCRAYSGKQDWLWTKRFEKGNNILKKIKKKYLTLEQKTVLENIKGVVESNKYLKRNHPLIFKDLQKRLDYKNSGPYSRLKGIVKKVAKYAGIAALAAALVFLPAKYAPKRVFQPNESVTVCTVKKGDNLWNLTKDYLKKHGVSLDDKTVYKAVDKAAEENGKGKQSEYKISGKEKKNPHHIQPCQKIIFSKNVLEHVKKGGKK